MPIQKDHQPTPLIINPTLQEKEESNDLDFRSEETPTPLPLTVTSRVLYMLGDITAGPAYRFTQWLELVRKRSAQYRYSGFPRRIHRAQREASDGLKNSMNSDQVQETSLWERLGKAAVMDIESSSFSWDMLSSLHHTEHSTSTEHSDDDPNKPLEVTVNSGGVVFFALFNLLGPDDVCSKEASAVIKISSSRMATQSERLGYVIAKWLGIETPQARVIHNCSQEWGEIKEAAEKARAAAVSEGDECGQMTCSELLEALELSRCIYLMSYVHGSPLLESSSAFESRETAEQTAAALGKIFMLDLIIRNEDRLPCRQLRWRGNTSNLLLADKLSFANVDALEEAMDSAIKQFRPRVIRALQKDQRCSSADCRFSPTPKLVSQPSDLSDILESPRSSAMSVRSEISDEMPLADIHIVAIDSGVPRRPPAGKRSNDQTIYPKLVELLLNNPEYASNLLHDISGGKLGIPEDAKSAKEVQPYEMTSVVRRFRSGFRAALRDLQGFHMFLITLHQKLDGLVNEFLSIINRTMRENEKDDGVVADSPSLFGGLNSPRTPCKEQIGNDNHHDNSDSELQSTILRSSSSANKDISDSSSPMSRESWHGKSHKGSEAVNSLRLTMKLRDFHKYAKVDAESHKELERWNEMLRNDVVKLCQENNFSSGFFEGNDSNGVVDAYELKIRLEHILERISLITEAASTERPSPVTNIVFIGGALAARSVYTLQYLGITHILCLCSNETGQADSQYHNLFEYKNFSISDSENTNISEIFGEACDFIDNVEKSGGKVLVHCFEGKSRSATVVIAYLMLRKNLTLLEAWTTLKRVHRRAQPNDGFARILVDLDRLLHGKVSMEWQQRKPQMKVCPICGKNAGLSNSSLKLHLQKSHKKLSSGSVDSAMTMEIQKALSALKISRSGSASPTERRSSTVKELD